MKRVLLALVVTVLFAGMASALPQCVSTDTLAIIIAQGGCEKQDKIFTNWSYTGGGTVTAADVGVNVIFATPASGIDTHGFTFTANDPATGVWTTSFTLGYTISVIQPSTFLITGAGDQLFFGSVLPVPNNTSAVITKTPGPTFNLNFTTQTGAATFAGVQSLTSLAVVTIPVSGPTTGLNFLASLEQSYTQTDTGIVPEPATTSLIGGALIGLGFLLRKRR